MMRRLNLPIAVLAAMILSLGGLVTAASAVAYNLGTVYKDCETNGTLTKHYPRAELQAALNALPAQVSEYSACSDVIRQALLRASSGGGGVHSNSKTLYRGTHRRGGGGSNGKGSAGRGHGSKAASVTSASTKRAGTVNPGGPINVGGSNIRPGSSGTEAAASSLPPALIVVLILLALTAVSGGAVAIRRRVVARHGT